MADCGTRANDGGRIRMLAEIAMRQALAHGRSTPAPAPRFPYVYLGRKLHKLCDIGLIVPANRSALSVVLAHTRCQRFPFR